MLTTVKNNDLSAAKTQPMAVVDFNATWCGPCRMLAPIVDQLADELDDRAEFYSVDVDENNALAQQFGISSIPCLVVLKNGVPVEQAVGFRPKSAVRAMIEKYL